MGKLAGGVVLSIVLVALGCGSSEDTANPTSKETDAGDAAIVAACHACVETACSAEIAGCASEPDCTGYLDCFRACPALPSGAIDEVCEDACEDPTSTAGKAALGALTACRKEGPGLECLECSLTSVLDQSCEPSELDGCPKCEEEKCCVTRAACDADSSCLALIACIKTCAAGDGVCAKQCYTDNEGGLKALGEHLQCVQAECSEPTNCGPVPAEVQCVSKKCANTQAACVANLDCWLAQMCIGECTGAPNCIKQCISDHASAKELLVEAAACALALCGLGS